MTLIFRQRKMIADLVTSARVASEPLGPVEVCEPYEVQSYVVMRPDVSSTSTAALKSDPITREASKAAVAQARPDVPWSWVAGMTAEKVAKDIDCQSPQNSEKNVQLC